LLHILAYYAYTLEKYVLHIRADRIIIIIMKKQQRIFTGKNQ